MWLILSLYLTFLLGAFLDTPKHSSVGIQVVRAADPRIILYKKGIPTLRPRKVHLRVARRRPMELDANADVQANPSINQAVEMNLEVKNAIEAAMNDTFNMFAATMDSGEREPKLVVAHHMVGNTYPYTVEDWKRDIQLASSHSIDGFVLNVGRDDWMTARVDDAYAAAQSVGNGFKLCLSLDMTSLPCATLQDVQTLQHWVSRYAHHPNQLIYRGKPLVSTFAGEGCTYGGSFATAWTEFKKGLGGNIHFVPSLFTNPAILNTLPFLDGIFNWNGGWPTQLNEQSSASQIEQAINSLNTDALLLSGMSDKTYIAAVSPWFFTHYGPDTWNKNWIYRGDDWLFAKRWEELIGMRDRVGIVEVISWNDYGESHYIGPIAGAQPNSQAWVDGFDHQGWLEMTSYYAQAFKTGSFPVIAEDKVFVWARPHPKDASAPDHVPRPQFADLTDDFFWVVIFAKSPATAILHAPPPNLDSNSVDHNAAMIVDIPAGVHKLRYPLLPGRTMAVRLERSGNVDLDYRADGFVFNPSPNVYNFNAWVGWKTGS